MTLPNFLVIGANKSGTTSLYKYLKQHPQVYMSPVKEAKFFGCEDLYDSDCGKKSRGSIRDIEAYRSLFKKVGDEKAIGEASPDYMYWETSAERIQQYISDVKLVFILRNPVERMYSQFLYNLLHGWEPLSDFSKVVEREEKKGVYSHSLPHCYLRQGFYFRHLQRYLALFDESQLKIILFEDFTKDPIGICQDIFGFLGVDADFIPDTSITYAKSGVRRSLTLDKIITGLYMKPHKIKSVIRPFFDLFTARKTRQRIYTQLSEKNLVKPPLPAELRDHLIKIYREDIIKLQDLIHRDLSKWLE